ncbi:hypothetical protein [Ureibacillus endophyticus]|uniref:Uncharacterized protein n=1 Tax=Ureibacillus endophyticus TaxID=1978490 RepID=A0A494Z4V5_9BACL|nr:hypothetical protein [Lysinibacillus endophyticus]RKQ17499.1 hypothetical protein D8M03_07875 [Lysinibacillus endophyticus]
MNKIAKIMMSIAAAVVFVMIGKAFILDEAVKGYLVTFFFVGAELAMLRLFINGMISKMKGKHIGVKIIFFAGLLSVVFCKIKMQRIAMKNTECCHPIFLLFSRQRIG